MEKSPVTEKDIVDYGKLHGLVQKDDADAQEVIFALQEMGLNFRAEVFGVVLAHITGESFPEEVLLDGEKPIKPRAEGTSHAIQKAITFAEFLFRTGDPSMENMKGVYDSEPEYFLDETSRAQELVDFPDPEYAQKFFLPIDTPRYVIHEIERLYELMVWADQYGLSFNDFSIHQVDKAQEEKIQARIAADMNELIEKLIPETAYKESSFVFQWFHFFQGECEFLTDAPYFYELVQALDLPLNASVQDVHDALKVYLKAEYQARVLQELQSTYELPLTASPQQVEEAKQSRLREIWGKEFGYEGVPTWLEILRYIEETG